MHFLWAVIYAIHFLVNVNTEALNIVPVNRTVLEQNGTTHIISKYLFVPQDNDSDNNQTLIVSNDEVISKFLKELESSESLPHSDKNVDTYKIYIKRTFKGQPQGSIEVIEKDAESKDFKQEKDSNMIFEDKLHTDKTIKKLNITLLHPEIDIVHENNTFDFIENEHNKANTLNLGGKRRSEQIDGIDDQQLIFKQAKDTLNIHAADQVDGQEELNDDSVRIIPLKASNISPVEEKTTNEIILTLNTKKIENSENEQSYLQDISQQLYKNNTLDLKEKLNERTYLLDTSNSKKADDVNVVIENITNSYPNSKNHHKTILKNVLVTLREAPENNLNKTLQQGKQLENYMLGVNDKAIFNETRRFENGSSKQAIPIHSGTKSYEIISPGSVQIKDALNNSLILKKNTNNALSSHVNNYLVNQIYPLDKSSDNIFILANQSKIATKALHDDHDNKLRAYPQILQNTEIASKSFKNQEYKMNSNEDEYELLQEFSLHRNTSQQTKNETDTLNSDFYDNQNHKVESLEDNVKDINLKPNFEIKISSNASEPRNTVETAIKQDFSRNILLNTSNDQVTSNNFSTTGSHISHDNVSVISSENILENVEILPMTNAHNNGTQKNKLNYVMDMNFQKKEPISSGILRRTYTGMGPNFVQIKTVNGNFNYPDSYYKLANTCPQCLKTYISQIHNDQRQLSTPISESGINNKEFLNALRLKEISKQNGHTLLSQNSLRVADLQNLANFQSNQQKVSGNVHIKLTPLNVQTYNKNYQINSQAPKFTTNSNQMFISNIQLFTVENLMKILEALEREKQTRYDKQLFNMYMIIKTMLETAKSADFNKNDNTPWLTNINLSKDNPTKDYTYKLIQQKWLQDLLYQLYVNDYDINIIKHPRWRIYLNDWYLPKQYQSMNNYNHNLHVDYNYDIYHVGIPREEVIAILNYIKPYVYENKIKEKSNINYNQYQSIILSNVSTYLKSKRYSECSIRNLLCRLDKIMNGNNSNSSICLPTCCLMYN